MGLKSDINDAFLKFIDKDDIFDDNQKKSIKNLSADLSKAIVDFIVSQEFTITEMKALLEVEEIKTATTLTADVMANRLTTTVAAGIPTAGSPSAQATTAPGTGRSLQSPNAVRIPKINFRKFSGQGGAMSSKGHAYIGPNPVDAGETNEKNTKVQLLKQNVKNK